ncbi:MAG: hypothetical protein RLZZ453_1030 [Chlamydiota bacterium]
MLCGKITQLTPLVSFFKLNPYYQIMIVTASSGTQAPFLIERQALDEEGQCPVCFEDIQARQRVYSHESGAHLAVHRPCLIQWICSPVREKQPLECFVCAKRINYSKNQLLIDCKEGINKAHRLAKVLNTLEEELTCIITRSHVYPLTRGLRPFVPNAKIGLNSWRWNPMAELCAQIESLKSDPNLDRLPKNLRVLLTEYVTIRDAILELKKTVLCISKCRFIFLENVQKKSPGFSPLSRQEQEELIKFDLSAINGQIINQINNLVSSLKVLDDNSLSCEYIELINSLEDLIKRTREKRIINGLVRFIENIPNAHFDTQFFLFFAPTIFNGGLAAGITFFLENRGIDLGEQTLMGLFILAMFYQTVYFIKNTSGNSGLKDVMIFHFVSILCDLFTYTSCCRLIKYSAVDGFVAFFVGSFSLKIIKILAAGVLGDGCATTNIKLFNISPCSLATGMLFGKLSRVYPVAMTAVYAMLTHLMNHTNRIWIQAKPIR